DSDQTWCAGLVLEADDHPVATGTIDTAVQELGVEPEPVTNMDLQEVAHLAELCEHQRPLFDSEQLLDELVEARQLAGAAGETGTVFERLCRVVADLLQSRQR